MRIPGLKWANYTLTEKLVALQDRADRELDPEYKAAMRALRESCRERRQRAQGLREITLRICQMRGIKCHDKPANTPTNGGPDNISGQPDGPRIQACGMGGVSVEIPTAERSARLHHGDGEGHHHPEHGLGTAGESEPRRERVLSDNQAHPLGAQGAWSEIRQAAGAPASEPVAAVPNVQQ
jgi:hypothetical protein